jgi:large subunit ribosomal protein L18
MRKPHGKIVSESLRKKMKRKLSIRKKINGTSERPRVCVVRSNKQIRAFVVDDTIGNTLCSVSSFGKNAVVGSSKTKEGAKALGKALAEQLKSKKLDNVVFDRNGRVYTGVIASFADSLRESGIKL